MRMKTWKGLLLGLLSAKESFRRDSDKGTDRQGWVIDIFLLFPFFDLQEGGGWERAI
jgi:hypothetical protein